MGGTGQDIFKPAAGQTEILAGKGNDTVLIDNSGYVRVQGDDFLEMDGGSDTLSFASSDHEWILDATGRYFGDPSKKTIVIDKDPKSISGLKVVAVQTGSAEGYTAGTRDSLTLASYGKYKGLHQKLTWKGATAGTGGERVSSDYEKHVLNPALEFVEFVQIENFIGSRFNDFIAGNRVANLIDGGAGDDVLIGHDNASAKGDRLYGKEGNDVLKGGKTSDRLYGGSDDDVLIGGKGGDLLSGGHGIDTANYAKSRSAVRVDLKSGAAKGGDATGDKLASIENLVGTRFRDVLSGNSADNLLNGGSNNDSFRTGGGNDIVVGGGGIDTVSFADQKVGAAVSLQGGLASIGRYVVKLRGVENVTGTNKADLLAGDSNKNILSGGSSKDLLKGLGGRDVLSGDGGNDVMTGGGGADLFDYKGRKNEGSDTITDFQNGTDLIRIGGSISFKDIKVRKSGDDTILKWADTTVTLEDIKPSSIGVSDFLFV